MTRSRRATMTSRRRSPTPTRRSRSGAVDLGLVHPAVGLGVGGVIDGLLGEAPVLDHLAGSLRLEVEEDLVGAVRLDVQGVQVSELVLVRVLQADLLSLEQVLALVAEDGLDVGH